MSMRFIDNQSKIRTIELLLRKFCEIMLNWGADDAQQTRNT